MKKILTYVLIFAFIVSCGGDVNSSNGNSNSNANNNNNTQDNSKDDNPCEKPTADDGETPPPLPTC